MRCEQVVGQGFPIRKLQDFEFVTGKHADLGFERMRRVRITRDHHNQAVVTAPDFSQGQSQRGAVGGTPLTALLG